ncbi:hypothetical protein [Mucilaginibacter aquatilis]|uniref:Uncharacterized protein n=1 Tax=Mucilaginibacter aquatilis TaxID=1517760 RepID=A0A6I4I8V2_9SPHI|nr:hypothetical protein [Mucilaginibacter aquatilis]MVN91462.1 hypothetical protein [Mucilaginibacter aquatilis]
MIPDRPGQICKMVSVVPDIKSDQVYIIAEDPSGFADDEEILVVNLRELQRNVKYPDAAARESVRKNELVVISENLENYIRSWNDR